MKKIIKLIIAIGILLFFKVLLSFTINEISISNYRKENYDTSLLQILYFLNINEPYIAYYNHGNILYQQEKYEDAIEKYTMALEKNPPKKRVCNIQINLVLAHVKTIDFQKKETALKQLKNARQILYNHHCADPNDLSGDSKESEELEEELFPITYGGIVLYGDLAPKYDDAIKMVRNLEYDNSYFIIVGTSFYTGISEQLYRIAKQRHTKIEIINEDASKRVPIVCKNLVMKI